MRRTLGSRYELELSVRTESGGARFKCDLSGLSLEERALVLRAVMSGDCGVEFSLHPLQDGRCCLGLTVGKPVSVEDGVKLALVN